jgi:hypothetical protein
VPFRFLAIGDLVVLVRVDATGVSTTMTLDTNYSVSGAGADSGGSVTTLAGSIPQTGETLIIYGNPAMTQLVDYISGGTFPAESHEEALDRLTLQSTRTREIAERALSLTDSSTDGSGEYDANNNDIDAVGTLSANKVTGLAVPTATTDATSKTYVDALVNTTIGPIPTSDAYVTATGSSTSRKLADRFAETFNVKDYGAQGDGATDDATAINAAFTAVNTASGGTVYFPPGTYVIGSGVTLTLAGPTDIVADRATLKVVAVSIFARALYVVTNGHDCTISGLEIDANQKANECTRIDENYQDRCDLTVRDCVFRNSYTDTTAGNGGAGIYGGWNKVTIDNCTVRDHTRAAGAGAPGSQGTTGIGVSHYARTDSTCDIISGSPTMTMDSTADIAVGATVSGTGLPTSTHVLSITNGTTLVLDQNATATLTNTTLKLYRIPRYTTVQNCRFENISNGDTGSSANNVDADGLKIFGGLSYQSQYIRSAATVSSSSFINCKGRAIKIQGDETTVTGNYFYRNAFTIIGGTSDCNIQTGLGNVSNNVFQYDPTSAGLSPFTNDGSTGAGSSAIAFWSSGYATRPKMMTATDNTILNNVDPAVGYMGSAIGCAGDYYSEQFIRISGNHAAGKYNYFVANLRPVISAANGSHLYANLTDNIVGELATAFMTVDSGAGGQYEWNTVTITGCHNSGAEVPAIVYPATPGVAPAGKYSVLHCSNITPEAYLTGNTANSYGHARIPTIAADTTGGRVAIQNASIADDAVYVFPRRAYYAGRYAMRVLSVGWGNETTGIFSDGTTSITDFARPLSATYTLNNVSADRSLDADTVAVAELADIVGTLIEDLDASISTSLVYGGKNKVISGATQANPVVITATGSNFSNGETVRISGVVGMTEINDLEFTVAGATANTFELSGVNGLAYTAYSSAGWAALNPDVDGKVCIYRDNTAESIVIKNRLGSSRTFTLITLG